MRNKKCKSPKDSLLNSQVQRLFLKLQIPRFFEYLDQGLGDQNLSKWHLLKKFEFFLKNIAIKWGHNVIYNTNYGHSKA